jgi:hypothetical protein
MTIFVIYDSDGRIWECVHHSFESAIKVVKLYLDQENRRAFNDGFFKDHEDRPAKLEEEFTFKDEQGGVMVAHNELEKISTFVKELSMY